MKTTIQPEHMAGHLAELADTIHEALIQLAFAAASQDSARAEIGQAIERLSPEGDREDLREFARNDGEHDRGVRATLAAVRCLRVARSYVDDLITTHHADGALQAQLAEAQRRIEFLESAAPAPAAKAGQAAPNRKARRAGA